ncbi:MAG: hypothetical protein ACO2O6_09715 [Candidatus Hydrothermia bacterium]|jgi:DNA repair exonuclease SbcCD ATPase subunit
MPEKLNKILEQLPEEYREVIKEAFNALIEEMKLGKDNKEIWQAIDRLTNAVNNLTKVVEEDRKFNQEQFRKVWQAINRLTNAIEKMEKTFNERFERQEKENKKIWQAIKERFERQEKENQRIWQAIEEMRKSSEEQFKRIWQAIEKTNERLDKLILAFEKAEKRNEQTRKQIGVLTDNFGYLLEDRAIRTLPKLLKERYGFEITEPLRRDFIEINGKYIEVNIYGKARKNNVIILRVSNLE